MGATKRHCRMLPGRHMPMHLTTWLQCMDVPRDLLIMCDSRRQC
jgi:hypothetical protein